MSRYIVLFIILSLSLSSTLAQAEIDIIYDIPFGDDTRQTLDVYLPPDNQETLATILLVHGGGFVMGDKSEVAAASIHLAEQGYAVVAPNYRLAPDIRFPSAHADVFCAMAWTFTQAEQYAFDLSQVVLIGESAGANIVAYLATVDDASDFMADCEFDYPDNPQYQAAITFYIPVDLLTCECPTARRMASLYTGISYFDWQADNPASDLLDLSVTAWLDDNDPPFYMIHGNRDFLVPVSESQFFVETYQAVGGSAELVIFENANHGFLTNGITSIHLEESYRLIDMWLLEILQNDL